MTSSTPDDDDALLDEQPIDDDDQIVDEDLPVDKEPQLGGPPPRQWDET